MLTNNLGYPRIGGNRELKKSSERYWSGKISRDELLQAGKALRLQNWELQKEIGIDLIPSNDFSFYDQVLDMTLMVGAIPERYQRLTDSADIDLYFALARGIQTGDADITAMEMTKWFDTNYHYIVPEFKKDQEFSFFSSKVVDEFEEAKNAGFTTKPVLIGPVSFLLLGKEKEGGFHRIELLNNILPIYVEILGRLRDAGAAWIQFDEPFLALDLTESEKTAFAKTYARIREEFPSLKILLTTYFAGLRDNTKLALSLPVTALHIDMVRDPGQLDEVLLSIPKNLSLSLGVVDGRNIWRNDFLNSMELIKKAIEALGPERVLIAPSCSLLHVPCDLDLEPIETTLTPEISNWLAFAKQKLEEVVALKRFANPHENTQAVEQMKENILAIERRRSSRSVHKQNVKDRINTITGRDAARESPFELRQPKQAAALRLPLFPTTTIGSFPQTKEVRGWRARFRKGDLSAVEYDALLKRETEKAIRWQESLGIDVLVHGEFERNDMVEYFGETLEGFAFTTNGWVQSYGSRCVKPPIIFGDVSRPEPMTVYWSTYAQSLTDKPVKGMLTGPVTILQWSFVRDDQPRAETCTQIALAIRDEVSSLESAGIRVIQIDEPAIREGLPLRRSDRQEYLDWAVTAFRIASSSVADETQIHTHMCYSEFNDIIENIAAMDADVITIECSRSQMELLDVFSKFKYPNEIGPGVYDIHSPRVPLRSEIVDLLEKARAVIPYEQLWVNPDCGLKTRGWDETEKAIIEMVAAARELRKTIADSTTGVAY